MSKPPNPTPSPLPATLDPAALEATIASLAPALEILERFHHRNKNQHRLSKWWAQADMLRRHLRKLLAELDGAVAEAERAARVRASKAARKKGLAKEVPSADDDGGVVGKRAGYLRWKLGPGAYLAFTQLAADRQFAHLGLMLLGVLAQVDKAVAPFAPAGRDSVQADAPGSSGTAPVLGGRSTADGGQTEPGHMVLDADTHPDADADMGVPVSRDEVLASIETSPQDGGAAKTPLPPPIPAAPSTELTHRQPPHPRARSLPQPRHTSTSQTQKTPKTAPASPVKEASLAPPGTGTDTGTPPPKPKARKKKGDEFDGIFGGLDDGDGRPRKKKKKKERSKKGGDEFDDIFGGL